VRLPDLPHPVYDGPFGLDQARRLLWRAGFGPRPGEAEALAALGLRGAVAKLVRPDGPAQLIGTEPAIRTSGGGTRPLAPLDVWGDDHLAWLDRMARTDQPLTERLTLVLHDWFAVSRDGVNGAQLMEDHIGLLRTKGRGSFRELCKALTIDPAMLEWLNGLENHRWSPNENYARELMELFTLGADRGAYTEADVRELARALTGWRADWSDAAGHFVNHRFDPNRHDKGTKTLWAGTAHQRTGAFGWADAVDLCIDSPYHRSFFVLKLWSYFIPVPPDAATQAALEALYVSSGHRLADVLEAILLHPLLYTAGTMVKPPIVLTAGLLRARGQGVLVGDWSWRCRDAGQMLLRPPNVAGWNDAAWIDTSTALGRWELVGTALQQEPPPAPPSTQTAEEALTSALQHWGNPPITEATLAVLRAFADQPAPTGMGATTWRQQRLGALRQLVAASPDFQVC
jgi:uncharacterized protein (DUF1800 family)